MGDVTVNAAVSLLGRGPQTLLIFHATNKTASNKTLVSAPWPAQFFSRYIRGYDRHH
jgi:hypothetical protein